MLPFLKPKDQRSAAGVIMKARTPDAKPEGDESKDSDLHACAQALITAVHSQDKKAVAEALKDAFKLLDAEPHEEGPHIEPHSYDSQKED